MQQEKLIRERIKVKVLNETGRVVRNVWYLATDIQNNILYGVSGNNKSLLAIAKINPVGEVEIII